MTGGLKSSRADRIDDMLFTVSGNGPHASLKEDLDATETNRDHYVVNIHVEDHEDSSQPYTKRRKTLETIDELAAFLTTATVDGISGRLLYRGAGLVADARGGCATAERAALRRDDPKPILPNTALPCCAARWPCALIDGRQGLELAR